MEINNLTFIVTDDCNFNCSYCFQKKEKKTISNTTVETTVDYFYPFLSGDKTYIGFYGGEPLLAYEKIEYATLLLQEKNKKENKNLKFSVTTNGTLLTGTMLNFFNLHKFTLLLSFDGLTQEKGRKKGTLQQMVQLVKRIRDYPDINLEINSVFSPETITGFSESLRFMIELQGPEITFNISTMDEWGEADLETLRTELDRLGTFLLSYYKEKGTIPVKNFRFSGKKEKKKNAIFQCGAGRNRMAVTPEGKLWGCFLFHDYFKSRQDSSQYQDYSFGALTGFIADYETRYPGISANYAELRQDLFRVEDDYCFLCESVEDCVVCPVNAAYSSGSLGRISCRQCQLVKIQRNARKSFIKNSLSQKFFG